MRFDISILQKIEVIYNQSWELIFGRLHFFRVQKMGGSLREKMDLVEHFDEDDQATKDAPPVNYVIVTNQIPAVFVSSIRRCAKNFQSN